MPHPTDPHDPVQVLDAAAADARRYAPRMPEHGHHLLERVLAQCAAAQDLGQQAPQLLRHLRDLPLDASALELLVELLRRLPRQIYCAAGLMTRPPSTPDWGEVDALVARGEELLAQARADVDSAARVEQT